MSLIWWADQMRLLKVVAHVVIWCSLKMWYVMRLWTQCILNSIGMKIEIWKIIALLNLSRSYMGVYCLVRIVIVQVWPTRDKQLQRSAVTAVPSWYFLMYSLNRQNHSQYRCSSPYWLMFSRGIDTDRENLFSYHDRIYYLITIEFILLSRWSGQTNCKTRQIKKKKLEKYI